MRYFENFVKISTLSLSLSQKNSLRTSLDRFWRKVPVSCETILGEHDDVCVVEKDALAGKYWFGLCLCWNIIINLIYRIINSLLLSLLEGIIIIMQRARSVRHYYGADYR